MTMDFCVIHEIFDHRNLELYMHTPRNCWEENYGIYLLNLFPRKSQLFDEFTIREYY